MDKSAVVAFFDNKAALWDAELIRDDKVINEILTLGGVVQGVNVLDVACGTGVLFDDYFLRNVNSVTGVDISSQMVRICKEKYPEVSVICADAETFSFDKAFDCIMIYNAFPHFVDSARLFSNLTKYLKVGGRLTVAHGMSRQDIMACHSGEAHNVSNILPDALELKSIMSSYLTVDIAVSDSKKYVVSGVKI